MGYKVTLYTRESSFSLDNFYPSGHTFIGLTDQNGNEIRRGFNMREGTEPITGYSLGTIDQTDSQSCQIYDDARTFEITEAQYTAICDEITYLENNMPNYDLFDHDTGRDDFNCVTFVEHLLRVGNVEGGNIKLGIIPHVVIDASYMNEYGNTYWSVLQTIANNLTAPFITEKELLGVIEFENGGIAYTKEGFKVISDTTSGVKVKAEYNQTNNQIAVSTNTEIVNKDFLEGAMDFVTTTKAEKITLNNQTFDIRNLTPIQLRNAIDGIDKVSFLLSNITIYVGEKLDLGSHGIYEVQSGDTLSMIAQNLNDGTVTKDLVKLNPWLFDAGRIHFLYTDKVLIAEGTTIDSTQDHVLEGDAHAANILRDSNGGEDSRYFSFEREVA